MPVYYYPSGQYPTSTTQQYRPIASVQYNAQRSQQIPQTAQQAGISICYSCLQLPAVPLLVKPMGCGLVLNLNSGGEKWSPFFFENLVKMTNWETFWLEIPSNGRADVVFSTTAVLHAVLCPQCPSSTWQGRGRDGRELVWAMTLHVQANHCSLSFIMQTPQTFVRLYKVDRFVVMLVVLHHFCSPRARGAVRWSMWLVPMGTSSPQRRAAGRGAVTL